MEQDKYLGVMVCFDIIVCSGCVWSGRQQTLARERYNTDFLLDDSRRNNFEHGLRHVPGRSELNFTYNGTCVGSRVTRCACLFSVIASLSRSRAKLDLPVLLHFLLLCLLVPSTPTAVWPKRPPMEPYLKSTHVPLISFS